MRYVYCVINSASGQSFGEIGVEDKEVYTIPYRGISLVVHNSNKEPVLDRDDHLVCYHYVIDFFTKQFNTVLSFGMGMFIKKEKVRPFLEKNYESFKKKLEQLEDRSEFAVKIFYKPEPKKADFNGKVKDYILKQKKLRKEVIEEIGRCREELYDQIEKSVDGIRIMDDKEDKAPLLSVACLVHKDRVKQLEKSLKKISKLPKFSVSLNGPWPVCSFV